MGVERCWVERVAGEKKPVLAIEQTQRIRCVPGCPKDFETPATQIEDIAVPYRFHDVERFRAVALFRKPVRRRLPNSPFADELGDGFVGATLGVARGVLGLGASDLRERVVAADMVIVGVRVDDDGLELGELGDDLPHIADTDARVEEQRFFRSDEKIGDHFLELARLIDSEKPWLELADLEPVLTLFDLGESASRRARELVPPPIFAFTAVLDELVIG